MLTDPPLVTESASRLRTQQRGTGAEDFDNKVDGIIFSLKLGLRSLMMGDALVVPSVIS